MEIIIVTQTHVNQTKEQINKNFARILEKNVGKGENVDTHLIPCRIDKLSLL